MLDNIGNVDPSLTDPSLFNIEHRSQLVAALSSETQRYTDALNSIQKYMPELDEFDPHVREIVLGAEPVADLINRKILDVKPARVMASEDSERSEMDRNQAGNRIVDLVSGYQKFITNELMPKYGSHAEDEVAKDSWQATWKLLQGVLAQQPKTNTSRIIEMFDGLVNLHYPSTYDKRDNLRGMEARQDISAVTFYGTFGKDIRANIWGSAKDN